MPYRIKARSAEGHTVTRMDLDYTRAPITDRVYAQQLAESYAETLGHGGPWRGFVEYYEQSIANPNWDRSNGRDY
jgi:hypothetical protein